VGKAKAQGEERRWGLGIHNGRNKWLEAMETLAQKGGKRAIIAWNRGPLGRGQARGIIYKYATGE
jgi:hypothetical protein